MCHFGRKRKGMIKMRDYREYVEQARKDGKEVMNKYSNGLDYLFIKENDGWYSIFDVTGGIYRPLIQAKDLEHAEEYIFMREPAPFADRL